MQGGPCPIISYRSNLHRAWDGTLIKATTWSWGAYVARLEDGWLTSPEAKGGRFRHTGRMGRRDASGRALCVGAPARE